MKFFSSLTYLFVCLLVASIVQAQDTGQSISEGPYIYYAGSRLHAKWLLDGRPMSEENLNSDRLLELFGWDVDERVLKKKKKEKLKPEQQYAGIDKVAVISDVHGQYDLMVKLLRQHGVMDAENRWSFGTGHLIVNGDIAGRGDHVTEAFWLVFHLELQAEKVGGKVHFLVGNHEQMLLNGDNRYLNQKYIQSAAAMGISVGEMYGEHSVLGAWLRNRPAIVKVDDYLIVHAGISPEFIRQELEQEETNKLFFKYILGTKQPGRRLNPTLNFLDSERGPVWYRGYFVEGQIDGAALDSILAYFSVKRIIVGHTSLRRVTAMHRGRVIAVDSNIKEGLDGEILLIENGQYLRGTLSGEKIPL